MYASLSRPLPFAGALVLLLVLLVPAPAAARGPATASAPVLAAGVPLVFAEAEEGGGSRYTWRKLTTGLASRSRVVQVCIVVMAIALFILMKKLTPEG